MNERLWVHEIEDLTVIDAWIMLTVTSTNTNAPTIMIAEKAVIGKKTLEDSGGGFIRHQICRFDTRVGPMDADP